MFFFLFSPCKSTNVIYYVINEASYQTYICFRTFAGAASIRYLNRFRNCQKNGVQKTNKQTNKQTNEQTDIFVFIYVEILLVVMKTSRNKTGKTF